MFQNVLRRSQLRRPDSNRRRTAYETVLGAISSPLRSTPGRTRTCVRPGVSGVPSPLGHGGLESVRQESNPPIRLGIPVPTRSATDASINRGGRSRTLCTRVGAALPSQGHTPPQYFNLESNQELDLRRVA